MFGYQYSEILRLWMCVYLVAQGIEDVTTHLMKHLSSSNSSKLAAQTPYYVLSLELTFKSITYKSASGKSYDFNTVDKILLLVIASLVTNN